MVHIIMPLTCVCIKKGEKRVEGASFKFGKLEPPLGIPSIYGKVPAADLPEHVPKNNGIMHMPLYKKFR